MYIKDQLYVQGKSPVEVANNFCRLRRIRWTKNDDTKLIAMFNEGKKTKEMMKAFPYRDRQHIDDHLQVRRKKHVPDFGESDSQEEKPTKRKRSDEEKEEDDSYLLSLTWHLQY